MPTATKQNKNKHNRIIPIAIGLIMLMELVDGSALNTSLPQIALSLHVNAIHLKIAITIYLLTLGMFIPAAGWLADRFGANKILLISIIGFIMTSLVCACATDLGMLTAARALQGSCGAFTMPVARLVMIRLYRDRLAEISSKIATIVTLGPLIGPLIGGALTTWLSWRFIFLINLPIGLSLLLIIWRFFPEIERNPIHHFDFKGFTLLASALITLLGFFDTIIAPMALPYKFLVASLGILFLISYILYAKRKAYPVINVRLFCNRQFRYFISVSAATRLLSSGIWFLLPLYLQTLHHYSALESALSLLPMIVGVWIAKWFTKPVMLHFKNQHILLTGLILISLFQFLFAWVVSHFNLLILISSCFLEGFVIGLFITIVNVAITQSLKTRDLTAGTIINSAVIQLSGSFAVSCAAVALILSSGIQTLSWQQTLPASSFSMTLIIGAIAMAITTIIAWLRKT